MPARVARATLMLLLLLLVAPAGLPPAGAQVQVDFTSLEAEVDFPETLTFTMEASIAEPVDTVQLFWKLSGAATTTMANVEPSSTDPLTATHQIDTRVQYIPPGPDIDYYWRITTADGTVHTSPESTIWYTDTRLNWERVDAGLVSVYWYQGGESFASEIAHSANRTLLTLEADFGISTSDPIRILVYANSRDFSSALRPNSAEWIGGVAYSGMSLIIAQITPGGGATREISRMIPHEIAHVVVHHAASNPYNTPPPWLDEGLATYVQEVEDTRLAPVLDRAVREGRLIPLGSLRSSFPADPDQAMLSYAQSESVVSFLVERSGRERVGDLVRMYQEEVTHDQALQQTLGITMDELDAEWKAWLDYEGDRVDDAFAAASDSAEPGGIWFLIGIGTAALFAAGMVVYFFWRTRAYTAGNELEAAQEAEQDAPNPPSQP